MNISNPKVSALIIGAGSIGERHLRCFQACGLYDVAICEAHTDRREAIAKQYNCRTFASLDEAYAASRFEVAVVCTPANSHVPVALFCLAKDTHVLIEKPLAITLDGLDELDELITKTGRIVRVAYTLRSVLALQNLKEIISSGKIGQVRHLSLVSGQNFPELRPAYQTTYYNSHETGGGAIQDALTHQINAVEWLVSPVRHLFAQTAHQVLPGVEVEDTVNLGACLADHTLVSFTLNQFQAPNETTILANGTLGSAKLEMHNNRIGLFLHGDTGWDWVEQPWEERDAAFQRQAIYFHDEIKGTKTPLASLAEATQTLKVNRAALESAQTHREVTIE